MIGRATDQREVAERANDEAVSRDAFDEEWRVACPEGHVRLEAATVTETAYCESCGRSYGWDALVDRKAPTPVR